MNRLFFIFLFTLIIISGCHDVVEINNRALVIGLGMDALPGNNVKVSLQIPLPENMGEEERNGGQESLFYTVSANSETAFDTLPDLQAKTYRSLFYGQIKVFIIGYDLAKKGLKNYIDFVERYPEIPSQAVVIIAEGKAEELLKKSPEYQTIPSLALFNFCKVPQKRDYNYVPSNWEFQHMLDTAKEEPEDAFLPILTFEESEKCFIFKGVGVFHGTRLVGVLNQIESRMFGILTSQMQNGYIRVPLENKKLKITYRQVVGNTKFRPVIKNGKIGFSVKVKCTGFLVEMTSPIIPMNSKLIEKIDRRVEAELTKEIKKTIQRLQKLNSDVLGWGELIRAKKPEVWRKIDWNREFPKAWFKVDVKFNTQWTGAYK